MPNMPEEKSFCCTKNLDLVKDLLEKMEEGDDNSVNEILANLVDNHADASSLYDNLGQLTRHLHDTLKNLDLGFAEKQLPNAQSKLSYVLEKTEEAANITMDGIEATIPISSALVERSKGLLGEWNKFSRRELSKEEFKDLYNEMMSFLESVEDSSTELHDILTNVLLAQNYQDLTGQAIKKVMNTVSDLEGQLVTIIALSSEAGQKYAIDGMVSTNNPAESEVDEVSPTQDCSRNDENERLGQNDVDSILSDLGF